MPSILKQKIDEYVPCDLVLFLSAAKVFISIFEFLL